MASLATLVWLSSPLCVLAAQRATIEPAEPWSNVFSGSEVKLHYSVRDFAAADGRLGWSLSVNQRTILRGEAPLQAGAATLPLRVPEVKEGVVLQARLAVAVYAKDGTQPIAEHGRPLWIFARDPLTDRRKWLKGLKITLFDPEGKTADVLEKADIPFAFTKNTAALDELEEGLLVIGEGTAWRDYPALGATMTKAAARGVPVLCLAPGEGAITLPGSDGAMGPLPRSLTLRREDVITELDNRLDAVGWPPEGKIAAVGLAIKSDRDRVVVEAGPSPGAWSWLEVRYAPRAGRLVVCGFGIVRHWETTPAPRYLLSELFARLTAKKQTKPLPQDERKDP